MPLNHWIVEPPEASLAEYHKLRNVCGLLDLGGRGRLCLTGSDRVSFLHGQITQDIKSLSNGQGAFAALVDAKGKIQSDLNVYILKDEILLDFEKGFTQTIIQRLEHHLVSEDVEIVDPSEFYSLLSLQGPKSIQALKVVFPDAEIPEDAWHFTEQGNDDGSIYICRRPRFGNDGFDVFIPESQKETFQGQLKSTVMAQGGSEVGEIASELARIQSGVPRMGIDMTSDHLVQETGLTSSAISFRKGCYIGQEVISRIRTVGKVNKSLCRLSFDAVPVLQGESNMALMADGKEAGTITSLAEIPGQDPQVVGLGYVKRAFLADCDSLCLPGMGGNTVRVQILGEPSAVGVAY
jgi:folate-binding protein YgfZ